MHSTKDIWRRVLVVAVLVAGAGALVWYVAQPYLHGAPVEPEAFREWYALQRQRSRVTLCGAAFLVAYFLAGRINRTVAQVRMFFTAESSPVNLAVFRILVFWLLLGVISKDRLVWFSELPEMFRVPPKGLAWANQALTFDRTLISTCAVAFHIFGVGALLGVATRLSTISATLLALYLLALPHFDGKVDHGSHHLIWFAGLLAASPSGDALSFDALRKTRNRAAQGGNLEIPHSTAYALPLRFAWILMGIIYFFPGFWKVWSCGLYWALSDNLKFQMYDKWAEIGHWTPLFRIDRYPLLYKLGGLGTIVFELAFVLLIFSPLGRRVALVSGLCFHWSTGAFMRIRFSLMRWCYVVLVDWHNLLRALGRRVFIVRIVANYDPSRVGGWIACVRTLDLLDRIAYRPMDGGTSDRKDARLVTSSIVASRSALTVRGPAAGSDRSGMHAWRSVLARVPLAWWLLPVTWIAPGLLESGARESRGSRRSRAVAQGAFAPGCIRWLPVTMVGTVLVAGNVSLGVAKVLEAWPFSCFPTFDYLVRSPLKGKLEISLLAADGRRIDPDYRAMGPMGTAGVYRLQRRILATRDPRKRAVALRAMMDLLEPGIPSGVVVSTLRAERVVDTTIPELRGKKPRRRLVAVIPLPARP